MNMFYYPLGNHMLEPVNHMQARSLLAKKLKEREENSSETNFTIWSSRNVNCPKFASLEDLDNWVSYMSRFDLPVPEKKRFN